MNAQKESLKKLPESLKKTSVHKLPVCDENESRRKNDGRLKYFLMEYKARAENSCSLMDIKRLQVNDSSYIEGTICLVNE